MRTHGDAALGRLRNRSSHHPRIAAMEAAGDVGGSDKRKDVVVGADPVRAEALPHVAVQIHPMHTFPSRTPVRIIAVTTAGARWRGVLATIRSRTPRKEPVLRRARRRESARGLRA